MRNLLSKWRCNKSSGVIKFPVLFAMTRKEGRNERDMRKRILLRNLHKFTNSLPRIHVMNYSLTYVSPHFVIRLITNPKIKTSLVWLVYQEKLSRFLNGSALEKLQQAATYQMFKLWLFRVKSSVGILMELWKDALKSWSNILHDLQCARKSYAFRVPRDFSRDIFLLYLRSLVDNTASIYLGNVKEHWLLHNTGGRRADKIVFYLW